MRLRTADEGVATPVAVQLREGVRVKVNALPVLHTRGPRTGVIVPAVVAEGPLAYVRPATDPASNK